MSNNPMDGDGVDVPRPNPVGRRLLYVVALIVFVESAVLVTLGVLGLVDTDADRMGTGIGSAVLLAGFGVALCIAGVLLLKGRAGARPPALIAQLLQILIATNFRGDPSTAISLAVPAVIAAALLISPPVNRQLAVDAHRDRAM